MWRQQHSSKIHICESDLLFISMFTQTSTQCCLTSNYLTQCIKVWSGVETCSRPPWLISMHGNFSTTGKQHRNAVSQTNGALSFLWSKVKRVSCDVQRSQHFYRQWAKCACCCKSEVIIMGSSSGWAVCWCTTHAHAHLHTHTHGQSTDQHYEFLPAPLSIVLMLNSLCRWSISQWGDRGRNKFPKHHIHTLGSSSDCPLRASACWRSSVMSLAEQAELTALCINPS